MHPFIFVVPFIIDLAAHRAPPAHEIYAFDPLVARFFDTHHIDIYKVHAIDNHGLDNESANDGKVACWTSSVEMLDGEKREIKLKCVVTSNAQALTNADIPKVFTLVTDGHDVWIAPYLAAWERDKKAKRFHDAPPMFTLPATGPQSHARELRGDLGATRYSSKYDKAGNYCLSTEPDVNIDGPFETWCFGPDRGIVSHHVEERYADMKMHLVESIDAPPSDEVLALLRADGPAICKSPLDHHYDPSANGNPVTCDAKSPTAFACEYFVADIIVSFELVRAGNAFSTKKVKCRVAPSD